PSMFLRIFIFHLRLISKFESFLPDSDVQGYEKIKTAKPDDLAAPTFKIWRRRQDSNLWYPFGVQRFSKPPLSATQP
ncbi:hypothetical protein OFC08_35460, partial [Escherichia coli]|nr:hypothetical protein [Escherichia coli]